MITSESKNDWSVIDSDLARVLERTEGLWEDIRGGRLFITGGTGFFGRWLIETFVYANQILDLQAQAVVLTRNPEVFAANAPLLSAVDALRFHRGDICDFSFPAGAFTHAIHAASALSHAQQKDPIGMIEGTMTGLRRVLRFAHERGVTKFLFTSSGAVYGPPRIGRTHIREEDPISPLPLTPTGAYGEAKRLGEFICAVDTFGLDIEVKIARGFAFVGPFLSLDANLAAANFMRSALRGEEIVIQGHGHTVRSYLYGADLAVWLWMILFRGLPARPYNLGSDDGITLARFASCIAHEFSPPVPVRIVSHLKLGEVVDNYLPDLSRVRSELALDVFTPLPEAIRRTIQFHRGRTSAI